MDKRREAFEAWWFVPIEEQKENLSPKEIAFMAWQAAEASLVERLNAREPEAKTNMDDNGYISVAFTLNWCGEQGMFWPKATLEDLK